MSFFDRIGQNPCLRAEERRRGAMLIIALGVLALMVILGTAFASIMRLEKIYKIYLTCILDTRMDRFCVFHDSPTKYY